MSRKVHEGVLLATSPTGIQAHDPNTAFGCRRRWWFKEVAGLEEPSTPAQLFGTRLHALIEHHMDPSRPKPQTDAFMTRAFNSARDLIDEVKPRVKLIECKAKLGLAGVTVNGRVDVVTRTGILDWKTSSDPQKYGKVGELLRKDTQMLLYAQWAKNEGHPWQIIEHVTIPSGARGEARHSKVQLQPSDLDAGVSAATLEIEKMKVTARAAVVTEVEAVSDRSKCSRCPFNSQCPKESKTLMALLGMLAAPAAPAAPAKVVPPDAPKFDPLVAAQPVPGHSLRGPDGKLLFKDVPSEPEAPKDPDATPPPAPPMPATPPSTKRGRGRPPKTAAAPAPAPMPPPVAESAPATFTVKTVRVSHGLTVSLGQFQSARIDVSLEADTTGDYQAAYETLTADVKAKVAQAAEEYVKSCAK